MGKNFVMCHNHWDKLDYKNSVGNTAFLIFALPSPVLLRSVKKQPKEKKNIKRTQVWLQNKNEIQRLSSSFVF